MEFVVLLYVFAIALTQVIARSIDMKEHSSTKDGYIGISDGVEELKFMLPTMLQHEFKITINGILNITEENFTVAFPITGDDKSQTCTLNFNYKSNSVIEASSAVKDEADYTIDINGTQDPEFILELEARINEDNKQLEITFNGNDSGPSTPVSCMIQSFKDLGHIHFKEGVQRIKSILFTC